METCLCPFQLLRPKMWIHSRFFLSRLSSNPLTNSAGCTFTVCLALATPSSSAPRTKELVVNATMALFARGMFCLPFSHLDQDLCVHWGRNLVSSQGWSWPSLCHPGLAACSLAQIPWAHGLLQGPGKRGRKRQRWWLGWF